MIFGRSESATFLIFYNSLLKVLQMMVPAAHPEYGSNKQCAILP